MMSLHVNTRGSGADLVLLHGWAMHGGVFDHLTEALTPHYRVHAIDLPGHGESKTVATVDQSLEDWIQAITPLIPDRAAVLGWSLGGLIALYLAARLPLRAVALVSSTPKFVADAQWPHGMEPAVFEQFSERLRRDFGGTVEDFLRLQVRGDLQAAQTFAELKQRLLQHPPQPAALRGGLKILRDTDARALLARLELPVWVVAGQHDRITHPAASEYLAASLPQAHLRIIKRAGHAPFISHRAEFVEATREFLDGVSA